MSLAQVCKEQRDLTEPVTAEQAWLLHDFADAIETFAGSAADRAQDVKTWLPEIWIEQYDEDAVPA